MDIKNLVFQGGGVKGIAYAGAIRELDKHGVLGGVVNVAGASAGAITAALLAAGVTVDELEAILTSTDFKSFMDGRGWVVGDAYRLFEHYGMYKGDAFEKWLQAQIGHITERVTGHAQPLVTFAGLRALAAQHPGVNRELYVVTTNLTRQVPEIFSAHTHPDLPVVKAVRMSMSIPLFFEAVQLNGDVYVDGGVSWNYPIDLFDGVRRRPIIGRLPIDLPSVHRGTLGFSLGTKEQIESEKHGWQPLAVPITGIDTYIKALFSFLLDTATRLHLDAAAIPRTVFIDDAGIPTTDFEITPDQMKTLVDNGASATAAWFAERRRAL
jgi:NTE family protein